METLVTRGLQSKAALFSACITKSEVAKQGGIQQQVHNEILTCKTNFCVYS